MTKVTQIAANEFFAIPVMENVSDYATPPLSLIEKGIVRTGSTTVTHSTGPSRLISIYERKDGTAYARVQYFTGGANFTSEIDVFEAADYMTAFLLAAA